MKEIFFFLLVFTGTKSEEYVWDFENYKILDEKFLCFDQEIDGVSEKCANLLNFVCSRTDLLMTMLDASSKFPYSGIGYSTRMDYGNFDQCMTVDYKYEDGRILGEHCTVGFIIPDPKNITDDTLYYKLSLCRPEGCVASDFNAMLSKNLNFTIPLFQDLMCQTKETGLTLTAVDYVTIVITTIVVLLMIISTIYDIYLYNSQSKTSHPLYLAFSVLSNGRKLLHISKTNSSKEQINTFHGLKVISMMWIVAGHGFVAWESVSLMNDEDGSTWINKRYAGYIATAPLAVDTFFFISGFLLAFQYLKQKQKPLLAHVSTVPHMYLHRYLRLTPALFMTYMFGISIYRHLGSGPLYSTLVENLTKTCKKQWWPLFLYIQNYYNWDDLCLTQTWYLSADMQMFLLSPLVLIPIALQLKNRQGFLICMGELMLLNLLCIALPMAIKLAFEDYKNTYDTHSRLINYYIGVMLALFMRVKIDKPFLYMVDKKRVSQVNLIVWALIILEMFATVMTYQEMEMNHGYEAKSIFYSLMRPAWCIGLSWIVYSCYHGYGGFVNWLLCRPIFQIWGRLTYCMYLVHGLIIGYYVITTRTRWYFNDYNAFYLFCGHYIVSTIISTFWTLAFESPLITIEKYLMGPAKKPKEHEKPPNNGSIEEGVRKEVTLTGITKIAETD